MDAKHSEIPWHYEARGGYIDSEQDRIAMLFPGSFGRENAAFIVRAVNSHDQLVAALKDCLAFLENDCPIDAPCGAEIRAARAALAAAEA